MRTSARLAVPSAFGLIGLALGGCSLFGNPKRDANEDAVPTPAPRTVRPLGYPIAARGAFDLVLAGEGAALFRAEATHSGAELRLHPYSKRGEPRRSTPIASSTSSDARITEVAAAGTNAELAALWLEETASGAAAFASLGTTSASSFASPVSLGSAARTQGRGRLALIGPSSPDPTARAGRFAAFHQTGPEACPDGSPGCSGFVLHQLEPTRATARRVTLSVPSPCARSVAGFAQSEDRWYYGVCSHQDGHPTTTFFTIEYAPEYAQAEAFLPDCEPLGITVLEGNTFFTAQCEGGRRAIRLGHRGARAEPVDLSGLQASCHDGSLMLRSSAQPPFKVRVTRPVDRLGPLLPPALAPDGARAAWTGQVLLVASARGDQVHVHGHTCEYRRLVETPLQ